MHLTMLMPPKNELILEKGDAILLSFTIA